MALVNPNIAMSFKPTTEYQPRNVLAEYAQLQQIQGGQRQSEMADMQMQEYRQNKEALGRIQAAIVAKGGPPDLKAAANEMIRNPQYMDKGIQILETLKNQEAMDAYFNPSAAQPTNALAPTPPISGALGSGTFDPMAPAAPVNALAPAAAPVAPTNAPVNQLGADRASIETKIAQLGRINDPRAVAEVKRLERQLTAMEPTPDIKTMTALGYPATREGFEAYRAAQRQEQLTFEQRKELARVGKSVTGGGGGRAPSGYRFTPSGELEAIPGGPAAAPAVKPMTALQQQKANKERVTEQQGVEAARTTANELEKLTDELAGNPEKGMPPHPGYKRIIGFESMVGSLPSGDAAKAEQKLETFKSKISTFGRQLATQYGKLGNMAVQEWKIVSDAVQNISPRAGNLDEQMRDVVRQARDFELSMQNKYDALYGDEGEQPSAPAQPSTKGSRTVTRTGMHNGKRVVQYNDGSLEYAD